MHAHIHKLNATFKLRIDIDQIDSNSNFAYFLKITFIEKNTGTDLFLVTIFKNADGSKPMGAVMSMHSYGKKGTPDFYNPYQQYGTCY